MAKGERLWLPASPLLESVRSETAHGIESVGRSAAAAWAKLTTKLRGPASTHDPNYTTLDWKGMMKAFLALSFVAILTMTLTSVPTVLPAAADPAPTTDCTQAESMLENAVKNRVPASLTGDVDKDFATIMMVHEEVGARIYQIEAKCGKNSKMRAMAANEETASETRMELFRNQNSSL